MSYQIRSVRRPQDIVVVRDLIREYVRWLDIDIAIKGFEAELPDFPGRYSPPAGDLLLARSDSGEALGCICLQPLELPGACEVKRLYVRPAARGMGLGRALATSAIERASTLGYREVMLDTLPWMTAAIAIYRSLGFAPIAPYWNNLVPGIIYLGKTLRPGEAAVRITPGDLADPRVIDLLHYHLIDARKHSVPSSHSHPLGLEGLQSAEVTFWTAWDGDALVGMGGLKQLCEKHGEVKSMHTAQAVRKKGVGSAMLRHIISVARSRGMSRLSLETGSEAYFQPAISLYQRHGFVECPPFADYVPDPNSVFMMLDLCKQ
jgi:putative acetyltransferase